MILRDNDFFHDDTSNNMLLYCTIIGESAKVIAAQVLRYRWSYFGLCLEPRYELLLYQFPCSK
jgi:hypothetical protein